MSEGFGNVLRGIRPLDWVIAGALTALGLVLMIGNVEATDAQVARDITSGTMYHPMSSHSWTMIPVYALAPLSVLWWRRNVVAVTGFALAVMVVHDLLFGWVTRCGSLTPICSLRLSVI